MSEQLLTLIEAGHELRLSRNTITRAVASGKLPTITLGRRRLVHKSTVDRLIALGGL
jgi:excisionase family DNA binding protein